jgi:hypothetical protein
MKNINAIKTGNVVNISIEGKLHKKNCGSPKEADELFRAVLKAKENPNEDNFKAVRLLLNERTRIAMEAGLEADPETGLVYLAGFNTPVPATLVEVVKEYHENNYPLEAIINFWKLLMINPDVRVRESLFDFITTHDFVLTDNGYMVVYKAVDYKKKADNDLPAFVSNQYLHVKKDWKCSPNKYVVYREEDTTNYFITKIETAESWDEKEKGVEILGKLGDMFMSIFNDDKNEPETIYTDKHTKTMSIVLGQPVVMPRHACDSDPARDCSYGLHVGATTYVERFASSGNAVLVCYVNPANVVAVPDYDHSKMRVSEYFPFAVATYTNGKIDIIEQAYFESDYQEYEEAELEELIAKVKANQLPIETAMKAEAESRPMSELLKMIETRLVDIE